MRRSTLSHHLVNDVGSRPEVVRGAIYVVGESMAPRYQPGEFVYVHPHRPVQPGDHVVVQTRTDDQEPPQSYIKRLVRRTATKIVCAQYNPASQTEFVSKEVVSVHKVLDMNDLFGV